MVWITNWWLFPARNAPAEIDIKNLFAQRPVQVMTATQEVIQHTLHNLRPTLTNQHERVSSDPPIMVEMNSVFAQGYKQYFEKLKNRRQLEIKCIEDSSPIIEDSSPIIDESSSITIDDETFTIL